MHSVLFDVETLINPYLHTTHSKAKAEANFLYRAHLAEYVAIYSPKYVYYTVWIQICSTALPVGYLDAVRCCDAQYDKMNGGVLEGSEWGRTE